MSTTRPLSTFGFDNNEEVVKENKPWPLMKHAPREHTHADSNHSTVQPILSIVKSMTELYHSFIILRLLSFCGMPKSKFYKFQSRAIGGVSI